MVMRLSQTGGKPPWEVFMALDGVLADIGAGADERLAYQAAHAATGTRASFG
ncbi:hypothetical protein AB0953_13605 [Streptomyces sp. NPDC046866]|uniref:hypothetical protein n=1 Tax=Streptomyces sp. NPDC046866 TaxID=3154921 RepID=UPI003455EBCB